METSIGEKMKPGETSRETALRTLKEELGIQELLPLIEGPQKIKGPVPSESFPGIMTKYIMYAWEVSIPTHLYKPEGYVEHQVDKTNYYVWKLVE